MAAARRAECSAGTARQRPDTARAVASAVYGVSNAGELGIDTFLGRLNAALKRGLQLVQIREKSLSGGALAELTARVLESAQEYGAKVLLNGDPELAARLGAHGVHLTSARLMALESRPDGDWVGASCHDERELCALQSLASIS